jgi:hypothetical protein
LSFGCTGIVIDDELEFEEEEELDDDDDELELDDEVPRNRL